MYRSIARFVGAAFFAGIGAVAFFTLWFGNVMLPREEFLGQVGGIPAGPTHFYATDLDEMTVYLEWTDNATNETGYNIERSVTSTGPFVQIGGTQPPDTTNFWDSPPVSGRTYFYRVKAVNGIQGSPFSNIAQARTPSASMPNLDVRLGPPRLIRDGASGPLYEGGYPDSAVSLLPGDNAQNPSRIFADHHAIANPFSAIPVYGPPLVRNNFPYDAAHGSRNPAGATDRCGDWFMPTMWQSTPSVGRIHGFFHVEGDVDTTSQGECGYGPPNDQIVQGIEYYYSDDNGATWMETDRPVLTSYYPNRRGPAWPAHSWTGVANPVLLNDPSDPNLYLFYKENGENWRVPEYFGMAVARAPKSGNGVPSPGSTPWQKYYNGTFSEPGLGGQSTFILSGFHTPMGAGTNSFFASKGTPYWLLEAYNEKGALLHLSNSIMGWSNSGDYIQLIPDSLTIQGLPYGNPATAIRQFPSVHFYEATTQGTRANFYYMRKPIGVDLTKRTLLVRDLTINNSTRPYRVSAPLISYARSDARRDIYPTTEYPTAPVAGTSYVAQETLGYVFVDPFLPFETTDLVSCYDPAQEDFYITNQDRCAGSDYNVEYLGVIASTLQPLSAPLYSCTDAGRNDRFVAVGSASCPGRSSVPLGYILTSLDPPPPRITSVSPTVILNNVVNAVTLAGENFEPGARAFLTLGTNRLEYPVTYTNSQTIRVTTPVGVPIGLYGVTVENPSGGVSNSMDLEVREPFNFSLSSQGNVSVMRGASIPNGITITRVSGVTEAVNLSVSGLPSGASASFAPTNCAPTCTGTLTIQTTNIAPAGDHLITVTGVAGTLTRIATFTLTINVPPPGFNFFLSNSGNVSVTRGSSIPNTITATLTSGTSQSISFSASGLPAGATALFAPVSCIPAPTTCQSTLTVSTSAATPVGPATIVVTGTAGTLTPTTSFVLTVQSIAPSPSPPPGVPTPPSGLTSTPRSATEIELRWTDNSTNETGFYLERSTEPLTGFVAIRTLAANATSYINPSLRSNTTYYYRVRARNTAGYSNYSNTANAATQDTAPARPTGLSAFRMSSSQIRLRWRDLALNETGYKVERSTQPSTGFVEVRSLPANTALFEDSGLIPRTTYFYRIRAVNVVGASLYSSIVRATTLDIPPSPPSNLRVTASSATTVVLTWIDASTNETNFYVERSLSPDTGFRRVRSVARNSIAATITGHRPLTTYYFRVGAKNAVGLSYSAVVPLTTPDIPPRALSSLTGTVLSPTSAELRWRDLSANESGFKIERRESSNPTFAEIGTTAANVVQFTDATRTAGTSYYYRVRAWNAAGNSAYSSAVRR